MMYKLLIFIFPVFVLLNSCVTVKKNKISKLEEGIDSLQENMIGEWVLTQYKVPKNFSYLFIGDTVNIDLSGVNVNMVFEDSAIFKIKYQNLLAIGKWDVVVNPCGLKSKKNQEFCYFLKTSNAVFKTLKSL